jgi:hypothetical protein
VDIQFLLDWVDGKSMTSTDQVLPWLEGRLHEHH